MVFDNYTLDELYACIQSSYFFNSNIWNEVYLGQAQECYERRRAIRDMYLDFAEELDAIRSNS